MLRPSFNFEPAVKNKYREFEDSSFTVCNIEVKKREIERRIRKGKEHRHVALRTRSSYRARIKLAARKLPQ